MKSRIFAGVVAVAITAASGTALADNGRHLGNRNYDRGDRDADYARVVDVEPLVERVRYSVPVEQCWNEGRVRDGGYRNGSKTGAAIVGGVVGALFGNAVGGHGDSRQAATVGGAVLGAAVGNEIGKNRGRDYREPRYEEVQRCSTRYEERFDERIAGYRVTYDYNGRRQVTQLPYDPGRYLRVSVDVHPLG
ncbi:MAG: glycine zipper 2TM domain-containing protein [Steroidobacteraceae bacterium]